LNISTYFIMSSPTGEVDDVVTDVVKLVADPKTLDDSTLNRILKDYNTEQLVFAPAPEGNPNVIVSAFGQVSADEYVDPTTGRVLHFDHRKRKFTAASDKKQVLDETVAKYRASIAKSIETYQTGQYKSGKTACAVYGADNGNISIVISAKNVNLGNFWSGGWRSVYTLNVKSRGATEMKGSVKINVHYFEDGNVQLHAAIDKVATINVGSEDETGKEISKALNKIETEFQTNMEEMYVNMHRTTFKSMRRFLPISRQPMNWNMAAHSLVEMTSGAKA